MLCFIDTTTNPYYNLAVEEYLLTHFSEPIFRLWRNAPSIIVGRNQNTAAEINAEYVSEHNIPVVRRLTGGGAVFHDLGNVNYTFIDQRKEGEDTGAMFARFTAPIIEALNSLQVQAYLEGRNDLLIDGRKFSGNALCVQNGRVLQHGTLLFSSSIKDLSAALKTRPEKFQGKSVKSNISRVTNISEHLPAELKEKMNPITLMEYLKEYVSNKYPNMQITSYTESDMKVIRQLEETRYSTWEWNYGHSPDYSFSNTIKLQSGLIEVFLDVKKGIIEKCKIQGDFFFTRPICELEAQLTNVPHTHDDIYCILDTLPHPLTDYIAGSTVEDLAKCSSPQ